MDATTIILIAVIVLLVAVLVGWLVVPKLREKRRSKALHNRFGSEYERTVHDAGDRESGEAELERREEHRAQLDIRPLDTATAERYARAWRETQKRFVDEPDAAIRDADELVTQAMRDRGYPVDDFEQRADDISVDHPGVVDDYRAAHAISLANARGEAGTEEQRQAIVHYRSLFDRLLDDAQSDAGSGSHDEEEVR